VDAFAIVMLGAVAGLVIALLMVARGRPGSGADLLDWKPTRSAEVEAQNEIDDLQQLLEVANRRRRRRGEAEITEQDVWTAVEQDRRASAAARAGDHELAELELDQMLGAANDRRRRKGLPELTAEEYRAQIEQEREAPS
jgi:hypothetical protein